MIDQLAQRHSGESRFDFARNGLTWQLTVPIIHD